MSNRLIYFLGLLWTVLSAAQLRAQTNVEIFGQNRVQHRRFDWKFYDAEHFKIYHYDRAGRELARYVAEQAEQDIAAIERRLGGLFPDKLNIMLYNCYDDFQQSNIGLNSELLLQNNNPAGTVNLVGDKLVIYFTGRHSDMKRQLRQGMAQVVMERLMFGENFREMVRNAVLLNLPMWATTGYLDYVVDGWTTEDDNDWKNLTVVPQKVRFDDLAERNPRLAGKAFWKYIAIRYGENNVKNLLYLTQLKSSLNKAMELTINQKLKDTYDSLLTFYRTRYEFEEQIFEPVDTSSVLTAIRVPGDESTIRDIMVSPRGSDVAYVKWRHGEYQVVLEKTKIVKGLREKETTVLLSGGVKNHMEFPDPDYPLLSWNNTGFKLGIIFRNKTRLRIRVYNSVKGKIEDFNVPVNRFDRITGFTFMEDDDMIILSAIRKGQSDLFEYRLKRGRMNQLTDDAWDDLAPTFVSGGSRKGVIFLSNRPQPYLNIKPLPNELPAGAMNAFFYNATTQSYDLLQLTRVNKGTISQPIPYGSDHFAYLWDQNGVRNRYVVLFARDARNYDSAYSVLMTNLSRSLLYHQYNPASAKIADVIQVRDSFKILFHDIELPEPDGTGKARKVMPLAFVDGVVSSKTTGLALPVNLLEKTDMEKVEEGFRIKSGNNFQSEFARSNRSDDSAGVAPGPESDKLADMLTLNRPVDSSVRKSTVQQSAGTAAQPTVDNASGRADGLDGKRILYVDSTFIDMRSEPYRLSFNPDFLNIRLDNSVVFNRYQSYDNTAGNYANPSLAGMLTVRLFDKMEDYRFTGGLRVPVNFSGLMYFTQFENFRRRVDWGLIYMRQETKYNFDFAITGAPQLISVPGKLTTSILQGSASYPFNKVTSVRMHFGLREDRMVMKARDPIGLVLPNTKQYWAMSRTELVYDDTRNPTLNIWNGMRYKLFAEYMYKLYSNNVYGSNVDTNTTERKGGFYNIGFDLRYYHKIYKNFIAAIRVAGAHSGGTQKILYFLGGVDNPINPSFSNSLQPSGRNDYAFQTLATNLRGYDQNARNGNTYAVLNAELRFPVLGTLLRRPVQSAMLKNLQVVAFTDIGSAWEGLLPTPEAFDRYYRASWTGTSPVIQVAVPNYSDNGLAIGYGAGVRTTIFGYFGRFDAAWNINGDFKWYLSIGTDF